MVNCYAEQAAGDARTRLNIRAVPGEVAFASLGTVLPRAVGNARGNVYAVASGALYEVLPNGVASSLGAVSDGDASIVGVGNFVAFASGGDYYVYNGTITTPGSGLLLDVGAVEFFDLYTVLVERDGQRFEWTELADPTLRNALHFATADARDDTLLRAVAYQSQLLLMGRKSIEVWYNTGAPGADAFARLADGVIDRGLKGYYLVTKFSGGVAFVGDDDVAYLLSAGGIVPISTPAVNSDLAASVPTSCFYYEARGHKFWCIRFSDRPAWCYDFTTQLWHRRTTGVSRDEWQTVATVNAFGDWLALNTLTALYRMREVYADVSGPLKRTLRGKPITLDGDKFSVSEFEVLGSWGQQPVTVMLRASWDGGQTWALEDTQSAGLGDYGQEVTFRALGRGDQFTPEVSVSDPVDVVLYSDAYVDIR